jgi:alpha-galactosidase
VLAPLSQYDPATVPSRRAPRETTTIDGVYLDTLDWVEATAGWGEVHRNQSAMGKMMMMAGRSFFRGLGTHAVSRIVFDLPPGYGRFAATIGCDQEVYSDSIVFVVMASSGRPGDGRELFRSPPMHREGSLIEVNVPIQGVKRLALIVEDGGNGIIADHADWADARLLR